MTVGGTHVRKLGYLLAALSAMAMLGLIAVANLGIKTVGTADLLAGGAREFGWAWLPELAIRMAFRLDGLSLIFGVLITGIGSLVLAYAGHYMEHESGGKRFLSTLAVFLVSMLGLVLANDLFALFLFWEMTSVTSFLLIGHTRTDQARKGAISALLVTGLGGVCLLAAAVLIRSITGTSSLSDLQLIGETLRDSPMYGLVFALVAAACLSKSAQFPLHFWLPDSMSAPTPASAFLHSATMVKAGIYLLLRLEPVMGTTPLWTTVLMTAGGATMLLGAYQGLSRTDLKAVLAYSTLSQLGALTMLIGIGGEAGRGAVVVGVIAHALYKSAMFLSVGIVDHAAGTRELQKLGGLRRSMPVTAALCALAAVSMAGLPPTAGFVGKEFIFGAGTALAGQRGMAVLVLTALSAAMLFAQAARVWFGSFAGKPAEPAPDVAKAHDPHPVMLVAVAIPALAGLALPWIGALDPLLSAAARVVAGRVWLYPWHGFSLELALSCLALTIGALLYLFGGPLIRFLTRFESRGLAHGGFDLVVSGVGHIARLATRLQTGDLFLYLTIMLAGAFGLMMLMGGLFLPPSLREMFHRSQDITPQATAGAGAAMLDTALSSLRAFTLVLVAASSLASVLLKRDLFAILALGASGLSMVLLFALEPAPDVALVMVVVDILTVVVLVLALIKIPPHRRREANEGEKKSRRRYLNIIVATVAGVVVGLLSLQMLETRPRESRVTPFYEANAKTGTGAADIVGAVVVDFRGFDTLIEIAVFSLAGLGVYSLLRYTVRAAGDKPEQLEHLDASVLPLSIRGIAAPRTSPLVRALAQLLLPLCLIFSAVHVMYSHIQPGDGFTAGVIASLGVSFYFVMMGYDDTRRALAWLRPTALIGGGILLVISAQSLSGLAAYLTGRPGGGAFFSPFDFGKALGLLPFLPPGFAISNSFLFDLSIFLTVLGSASLIIDTLGHPDRADNDAPGVPFSLAESAPVDNTPTDASPLEPIGTGEDVNLSAPKEPTV